MWLIVYKIDLWHDLHHNMYGWSWIIPKRIFLHPLLWRNIDVVFHRFCKFYFLSTLWVHVDDAWDITFHILVQVMQVLLGRSCIHWGAWWDIKYHSVFGQWCAWLHQPSYWGILHVIYRFFQFFSNERFSHEDCIFKLCVHWKGWFLRFYFVFFLYSPILLNNVFMVWSVCSELIPYLPWIVLMLRRFSFGNYCKV